MSDPRAFAYLTLDPANRSERLPLLEMHHVMRPFQHDMVMMEVRRMSDSHLMWDAGTPLMVTYGSGNVSTTFYGYVLSTQKSVAKKNTQTEYQTPLGVVAIGASFALKQPLSTVYVGQVASNIAFALATKNYFDSDIPPTSYSWPMKNADGCSQWTFLSDLARSEGRILYMHKTQLRMYDALEVLRRNTTTVPLIKQSDTLLKFDPDLLEISSSDTRRKRIRTVNGIDQFTGQDIYSIDYGAASVGPLAQRWRLPTLVENVTDLVTPTQADADALLPARAAENRFPVRAASVCVGDTRITQASPIVITGVGQRDSGIWQVIEATHVVKPNLYTTEMELGRDSDYDNGVRPGLLSDIARPRFDPYANIVLTSPPTVLVNNQWRSAWSATPGVPGAP